MKKKTETMSKEQLTIGYPRLRLLETTNVQREQKINAEVMSVLGKPTCSYASTS